MFTGITAAIGQITQVKPLQDGVRITVDCGAWPIADVAIGDSIMHQGVCLTVVEKQGNLMSYDVSAHSLSLTTGLAQPGRVNLEKSLRLSDVLGGHLVSGHVDGLGHVAQIEQLAESWRLVIDAPDALAHFIARKGSIAINGVSLTVNAVEGSRFEVNLIPHTWAVTTLSDLQQGSAVNLEVDPIARYVERMLSFKR
jgi:riboflavin synthase